MRVRALSISELNRYIKKIVTSDPILNNITIKGEISNFKFHGSGHLYFSMKDETSKINCVMFREHAQNLKFIPKNGMNVLVKGNISIFERDGQYQIYIREMEPDGVGALYLTFLELKNRLQMEGYFDPSHKKKIPFFPEKIALITSPTGAAIRDLISVIKRRSQYVDILIYPVLVQGENASNQIAQAIEKINRCLMDVDLIIIGRGGGSIEELWAFNEEIVARSVYSSKIPIISAVGHETDFTISDFVADLRAPTPSVAGELAVPRTIDLKNELKSLFLRLNTSFSKNINKKRDKLNQLSKENMISFVSDKFNGERQRLDLIHRDILHYANLNVEGYKTRLVGNISKLEAINPLSTVLRGYGIVLNENKNITIDAIEKTNVGDSINIMLTNGSLSCVVTGKEKEETLLGYLYKFKDRGY